MLLTSLPQALFFGENGNPGRDKPRHPNITGGGRDSGPLNLEIVILGQLHAMHTMFKSQIGGLALNRRKWLELDPEWSPGPEKRCPGFPRPFSLLGDQSCGPKPPQYSPDPQSTVPAAATCTETCRSFSHASPALWNLPHLQSISQDLQLGDYPPQMVHDRKVDDTATLTTQEKNMTLTAA